MGSTAGPGQADPLETVWPPGTGPRVLPQGIRGRTGSDLSRLDHAPLPSPLSWCSKGNDWPPGQSLGFSSWRPACHDGLKPRPGASLRGGLGRQSSPEPRGTHVAVPDRRWRAAGSDLGRGLSLRGFADGPAQADSRIGISEVTGYG